MVLTKLPAEAPRNLHGGSLICHPLQGVQGFFDTLYTPLG